MAVVEPAPSTDPASSGSVPTFSVVDIETSGLSTRRHHILQVAVAQVERGEIVTEWSSLIKLRWPWQRVGPRRVHGITRDRLRGAPGNAEVLADLADRVNGTILVAHNMNFDWPFLERAARRHKVVIRPDARLCTLRLSRGLDPDRQQSHRLADVCARYDVVNDRPHDAIYDARATALVLPHLLAAHGIDDASDLRSLYER